MTATSKGKMAMNMMDMLQASNLTLDPRTATALLDARRLVHLRKCAAHLNQELRNGRSAWARAGHSTLEVFWWPSVDEMTNDVRYGNGWAWSARERWVIQLLFGSERILGNMMLGDRTEPARIAQDEGELKMRGFGVDFTLKARVCVSHPEPLGPWRCGDSVLGEDCT